MRRIMKIVWNAFWKMRKNLEWLIMHYDKVFLMIQKMPVDI